MPVLTCILRGTSKGVAEGDSKLYCHSSNSNSCNSNLQEQLCAVHDL